MSYQLSEKTITFISLEHNISKDNVKKLMEKCYHLSKKMANEGKSIDEITKYISTYQKTFIACFRE
jgi:hypothetical protein